MRSHAIALWRRTCLHQRELIVTAALIVTATELLFLGPWLLALAALEWKLSGRRKRLLSLALAALLLRALVWLCRDLCGVPHGRWHSCAQCGAPIEAPSRAWYCSPGCRRYARLERDAEALDPEIAGRARARLRRLREQADMDPELIELPF